MVKVFRRSTRRLSDEDADWLPSKGRVATIIRGQTTEKKTVATYLSLLADDPSSPRQPELLLTLYTRGKHNMTSTISATRKSRDTPYHQSERDRALRLPSAKIQGQTPSSMNVRLRQEDAATLQRRHRGAVQLLYIKLTSENQASMLNNRFDHKLVITHEGECLKNR